MFRIVVSLREKRSTQSQFENVSIGCDIEANNLELNSPDAIVEKTKQLFVLARSAVQQQLLDVVPEHGQPRPEHTNGNGHDNGNGNGHGDGHHNGARGPNGNGNGRSFGRPHPEPSAKQRVLLQRIAKERGLSAEQVGEIARRELGKNVPQLDRNEMSRLIETLLDQAARP